MVESSFSRSSIGFSFGGFGVSWPSAYRHQKGQVKKKVREKKRKPFQGVSWQPGRITCPLYPGIALVLAPLPPKAGKL
jgi:hypothetical protein